MPAPAAPTSLTLTHRAVAAIDLAGGQFGDVVALTSSTVPGADSYVFACTEIAGEMVSSSPVGSLPQGGGMVPATTYHGWKVKARNADGDSAWYVPGLDITARALADLQCAVGGSDLNAPTSVTASITSGVLTATYSLASTAAKEAALVLRVDDGSGGILGSATYDVAPLFGASRTVTCPVAHGSAYFLTLGVWGFSSPFAINEVVFPNFGVTAPPVPLSPSTFSVQAGVPFSQALVSAPTSAVLALLAPPPGLSLTPKTGTAPQVLSGTLADYGLVTLQLTQTATGVVLQTLLIHVADLIAAPAEIRGWQGDQLVELLGFLGTGTVNTWFIGGQPPGVTVATGTTDLGTGNVWIVQGAPTAAGLFEATLMVEVTVGGVPLIYRRSLRFLLSGGLFLDWFHDDPSRRDLQWLLRSNEVQSLSGNSVEQLWLKRGDDAQLYVILRESLTARTVVSDGVTELRLVIRPRADFDADPYLDLGGAAVTELVSGFTLFVIAFPAGVTSPAIETAFAALNNSQGAEPAAVDLPCDAELTMLRNGQQTSSRTFPCTLAQDVER